MSLIAITYDADHKKTVEAFNSLPIEKKLGSYWNEPCEESVKSLKKYIKNYYILHQDYTCAYCQQTFEIKHNAVWDVEHILSKDLYPCYMFEPQNLCIVCKECNQEKSNKDVLKSTYLKSFPVRGTDYQIVHPLFDDYGSFINRLKSFNIYIPINKKGRKTIEVCGLLRFLYKFSDYQNVSLELKKRLYTLNTQLMETNDQCAEGMLLAMISDMAREGHEKARRAMLDTLIS